MALITAALGVWMGAPPAAVVLAAMAFAAPSLVWPMVMLASLFSVSRRRHREGSADVAAFLLGLAGEVQAGRSLRSALTSMAAVHDGVKAGPAARLAEAGRPMGEVALALTSPSPALRPASAALEVSARTGGKVAEVFESLALDAVEEAELRRQLRADSAPARLSALVVAGFPVAVVALQLGGGGLMRISSAGPVAVFLLVAGLVLLGLGVALTVILLSRSGRIRKAEGEEEELVLFSRVLLIGLSGGLPLHSALRTAAAQSPGPLRDEVISVLRAAGGQGLARALVATPCRVSGALMARLAASQVSGAPVVATTSGFLTDLRSRIRNERLRRARRLPVQLMFPLGLLILPGFILVFAGPLVVGSLVDLFGSLP